VENKNCKKKEDLPATRELLSIIQNIGNEGLVRFRIGLPGKKDTKAMDVVLKNF